MRWVKASERLPDKDDFYYVKFKSGKSIRIISKEDSGDKNFEWLDETEQPASECQDELWNGIVDELDGEISRHEYTRSAFSPKKFIQKQKSKFTIRRKQ